MSQLDILGAKLAELEGNVRDLQREPRLSNASLDDAGLYEYDIDGNPVARIGKQYDGTHTSASLAGPTPPTPTPASVRAGFGELLVRWDGHFADSEFTVAPMDFKRVEIHVGPADLSGVLFDTLRGSFETARGGEFSVRGLEADVDYWVRLTARSESGKFSNASAVVGPFRVAKLAAEDLDIDFEALSGTTVFYGADEPVDPHGGDLWLKQTGVDDEGRPEYETNRYVEGAWAPLAVQGVGQALADAIAAANAALAAQETADGRTQLFAQATEPAALAADAKGLWLDTDNGNRPHDWSGTAWVERLLGNGAIQPQSLVASDVIATGTVSAALLETVLVLATTIVAGDPNGNHVRLDEDGFRAFRLGPEGTPLASTRLGGPLADVFSIMSADGLMPVTYGDNTGKFTTQSIYSEAVYRKGRELQEILDDMPRGIVERAVYEAPSGRVTSELGVIELGVTLQAGRLYEVRTSPLRVVPSAAPQINIVRLRYTNNGSPAYITSAIFQETVVRPASTEGEVRHLQRTFVGSVSGVHRFLLTLTRDQGSGDCFIAGDARYPIEIIVEDKGRWRPQGGTLSTGLPPGTGGTAPVTPRQTYERQYACTWTQTFRQNGTIRTDTTDAVQGYGDGFNGLQGAMLGFQDFSGDVAGSTINAITLFMYAVHAGPDSGAIADIGYHGAVNPPGVMGGAFNQTTANAPKVGSFGRDITAWASFIANGTFRGIVLGRPATNALDHYLRVAGAGTANRPVIVINFTK